MSHPRQHKRSDILPTVAHDFAFSAAFHGSYNKLQLISPLFCVAFMVGNVPCLTAYAHKSSTSCPLSSFSNSLSAPANVKLPAHAALTCKP